MSGSQPETFSPRNIAVLGGLLLLAVFIGEVLIGPNQDGEMTMAAVETEDDIAMRLKPVVTLDDITSGASSSMAAAGGDAGGAAVASTADMTPDQLYNGACLACHTTGAAGAPKIGDPAAWTDRLGKGVDALVASAIGGIGAMPARGGSALDDDQIRVVVEYILENSR